MDKNKGFTLIELLVVVSIIGILMGLSLFSFQNSKKSGRDAKRKSDLELIRSGIEIYRADCGEYPTSDLLGTTTLIGNDSTDSCLIDNEYINNVPTDPQDPTRTYRYFSDGITYEICTSLENVTGTSVTCGGSSNCGETCNYKVENP
ncbi:MAG: type II secretion system protein [Patescibacteria group bacterium]|nr:type II secretion system GspH family protein [Patescibacteria group bacterium]MBU2036268.1 type II secretion system GspH family protein [Patescibacteria group bacterium]